MRNNDSLFALTLVLFLVSSLSAASLGFVYEATKGPKAKAELTKQINAIKLVVPEFNNDPVSESYKIPSDLGDLTCFPAKKDGKLVATAIKTFTKKGYAGYISVMVGLSADGSIYDTVVLEQKETPGLGSKLVRSQNNKINFVDQFKGKNPSTYKLKVKKDGGDVDAITAATVSSRAFCDAIQRAYNAYMKEASK